MKIVAFDRAGKPALGVVDGDTVVDLAAAAPSLPADLADVLRAGALDAVRDAAKQASASARLPLAGIKYRMPIANPPKILCLGLNYAAHAKEGGREVPEYPALFLRCATSMAAHEQPMIAPRVSDKFDYEAELMVIIGKRGRHLPRERALDIVAGYACFNDGSIRDYQRKTTQWCIGKNFDATGGFGPWMVTADELPPGAKGLRIRSILNGQTLQDDNTSNMVFDVVETIHLYSQCMTFEPGDVIAMGTPEGVGYPRKPPIFMKHGDTVEIDIEGVGTLRNPIVGEAS
jgi:2-keto-4-pentenoate hydratase/2-oxohepta-3-ene-1,7-dioic acid hydratase in catechol pathway